MKDLMEVSRIFYKDKYYDNIFDKIYIIPKHKESYFKKSDSENTIQMKQLTQEIAKSPVLSIDKLMEYIESLPEKLFEEITNNLNRHPNRFFKDFQEMQKFNEEIKKMNKSK